MKERAELQKHAGCIPTNLYKLFLSTANNCSYSYRIEISFSGRKPCQLILLHS